jgi:Papain-like cysteine protease AvrRpt2
MTYRPGYPFGYPPPKPRRRTPLLVVLAVLVLGVIAATGAVWTNTLGAGERFHGIVERVRLAIDPPPDREIAPTIEITDEPLETEPPVDTSAAGDASPTPRPERRPVDFKIRTNPDRMFASQQTNDWCAVAGVQMVLAMHGVVDNSVESQRRIANQIDKWESWKDSHNGGWGPAAIRQALADHGVEGYEIRSYRRRDLALRDTAKAVRETRAPVILIAWRGAHTWVMTGYRADADPTIFRDAAIRGAYIYDPWYPRVSTIWGPSDGPGVYQNDAEMERNFLRWERPEGAYPERDGKYIAVVPTIPLSEQRGSRG